MDEIKKAVEEIGSSFEEFKKTQDAILEAKASGEAVSELESKLAKIEGAISDAEETKANLEAIKKAQDEQKSALSRIISSAPESKKGAYADLDLDAYGSALKKLALSKAGKRVEYTDAETKALSSGSDPDGGFTIVPFMGGPVTRAFDSSNVMRSLATVITIGTNEFKFPYDDDELEAVWTSELGSRPDTDTPEFGMGSIPVHTMYARPKISEELLEDSEFNLGPWIQAKGSERFARKESASFISGTGNGQPTGILTPGASADANVYERGKIGQVTATGTAGSLDEPDDLITLQNTLKADYQSGAGFIMNRFTKSVVRKLKDGDSNYLWAPGLQPGESDVLLGKPVHVAEDMPNVGAGALAVAYGDVSRAYVIVDRLGISVAEDRFTALPFIRFYMRKRVGAGYQNWDALKLLKINS